MFGHSFVKTEMAATVGTDITIPMVPASFPPISNASRITKGETPIAFCITFGTTI